MTNEAWRLLVWTRFRAAPEDVAVDRGPIEAALAPVVRGRLFKSYDHRRHVEPAADGWVRYVDEITFEPAVAEAFTASALRRALVRRHKRAAVGKEVDPNVVGVSTMRRINPDVQEEEPDLADT